MWIGVGIVCGVVLGGWFPDVARRFELVGQVFLNLLMMLVIPLVILSMIVGISGLGDVRRLGAIGWRTIAYYLGTTCIAVALGLLCVNLVEPGVGVELPETSAETAQAESGPRPEPSAAEGSSEPVTDTVAVVRQIVLGDPSTGRQG